MRKGLKIITAVLSSVVFAASASAFAACGGSGSGEVLYDGFGSEYIIAHSSEKAKYTFEAEYTNLNMKEGSAFSGAKDGKNMAYPTYDDGSNGFCVTGLCKQGVSVNFVIVSDRDVDDAVLTLRLGNEYFSTFTFDADMFQIRVDPVSEDDVDEDGGAWGNWDVDFLAFYNDDGGTLPFAGYYINPYECGEITVTAIESAPSGFENYVVSTHLKLQQGLNCISLITNNNTVPNAGASGTTLYATAPVVDNIQIETTAQLGFFRPTQNNDQLDMSKACTVEKA